MLKLKRFDKAVWFDFPGYEGVKLKVKPLSKKASLDCLSNASRLLPHMEDGRVTTEEKPSQFIFMWEVFKTCLDEWKGIDFEGEANPPRDVALIALFEHDGLKEFVWEKANELAKKEGEKFEEELKNSGPSQGG